MDILTLMALSAVPATLVVLGGMLALYLGSPEKARRRFLFYILGIAVLGGLAALLCSRILKTPFDQIPLFIGILLSVYVGIIALVVLHLGELRSLSWSQRGLAALLLLVLICLWAVVWDSSYIAIYYIVGIGLALAIIWASGLRWSWLMGVFFLTLVSANCG
jgi:hypothetical protein